MIYLRVKPRVTANAGETLRLRDVAGFLADARCQLNEMRVILPKGAGVWQVDALSLVMQIMENNPKEKISVLGDGIGWLHREARREEAPKRAKLSFSRVAIAFFALSVFSALLILLLSIGRDESRPYWAALPYVVSMLLGVAAYARVKMRSRLRGRAQARASSSIVDGSMQSDVRRDKKTGVKRGKQ